MKLGMENRKETVFLAVLLLVAGYLVYTNLLAGPDIPADAPDTDRTAAAPALAPSQAPPAARTQAPVARGEDFRPVLRSKRAEDRIDPLKVDPTLRLDALERLQQISSEGTHRNLFQFGAPPPPPQKAALNLPEPVVTPAPRPTPAPPPSAPPQVPIPLKYFGISTVRREGARTAFFLDGDDIILAREGDIVKKRYRVVRIGATSVLMEDTELKLEQSLALADEAASRAPG